MNEIAPVNSTALMSFIERAAINPDFDVQKFGELLRMQREMEHDQARRAFNQAMAITQADMPPVVRSATNKHLGNKYAKLEDVDREMRPIYTAHGFSVRFGSAPAPEGYIRITCTVAHASGYFEENYLDAPTSAVGSQGGRTATTGVQAVGSAVTYLRRYLLGMVFNIVLADDDDDGESMRSQPASTPRYQRKYGTAEEPKQERTKEQWIRYINQVIEACEKQTDRAGIEEVAARPSVEKALADAPPWAKDEIENIIGDFMAKFAAAKPSDDLDEVVIAGEHNLAAG
jgi:hypothetical protein